MRRAHRGATVAAAAAVLATAGCGVAAALTTSDPPPGEPLKAHVRGTVTAVNGPSWTVGTAKKGAVTVTLTPQTKFGTAKAPAGPAQFPIGSEVKVTGVQQGDAVAAERIGPPAPPA